MSRRKPKSIEERIERRRKRDLVSLEDAAKYLGISRSRVIHLIRHWRLAAGHARSNRREPGDPRTNAPRAGTWWVEASSLIARKKKMPSLRQKYWTDRSGVYTPPPRSAKVADADGVRAATTPLLRLPKPN